MPQGWHARSGPSEAQMFQKTQKLLQPSLSPHLPSQVHDLHYTFDYYTPLCLSVNHSMIGFDAVLISVTWLKAWPVGHSGLIPFTLTLPARSPSSTLSTNL